MKPKRFVSLYNWIWQNLQLPDEKSKFQFHEMDNSSDIHHPDPQYIHYRLCEYLIVACVLSLLFLTIFISLASLTLQKLGTIIFCAVLLFSVWIFVLLLVLIYLSIHISYNLFSYSLGTNAIHIQTGGIFSFDQITISYRNIQDINVVQGPLQRYFGIKNIFVETAGGSNTGKQQNRHSLHTGQIIGIHSDNDLSEKLRKIVSAYSKQTDDGLDNQLEQSKKTFRDMIAPLQEISNNLNKLS